MYNVYIVNLICVKYVYFMKKRKTKVLYKIKLINRVMRVCFDALYTVVQRDGKSSSGPIQTTSASLRDTIKIFLCFNIHASPANIRVLYGISERPFPRLQSMAEFISIYSFLFQFLPLPLLLHPPTPSYHITWKPLHRISTPLWFSALSQPAPFTVARTCHFSRGTRVPTKYTIQRPVT